MDLQKYKALFFVVIAVSALLVASPALQRILVYPQTEFFTEMWLLGPAHNAEGYPHNVANNSVYNVYLGLANHLGNCAYYLVEVKFRNETQPEADTFNRTFSTQPSLYNMTVFVADKETWEVPLSFSFNYYNGSSGNVSQVNFSSLQLNDISASLKGYSTIWNSTKAEFFGSLSFELWLYNSTISSFQYHERFLTLRFNMTGM